MPVTTPKLIERIERMSESVPIYEKDDGTLTTKPQQKFVHSTYRGALAYSGYYENKKPVGYLSSEPTHPIKGKD